ncbi:MAG: PEGA domain-containing protein [Spirochaetales bacterium]|nr:PEGA domain-containing protein [Spirochaetales bacterium]MCF7937298.1 PEGA domain-containing protein [Spirochaetales bacterium]
MRRLTLSGVLLFLLFSPVFMFAENIYGTMSKIVKLQDTGSSTEEFTLKLEELASITVPKNPKLLQGFEVLVTLPGSLEGYSNAVAGTLYKRISPLPQQNIRSYRGQELHSALLPGRGKQYLLVSLSSDYQPADQLNTTVIEPIQDPSDAPFLFTILPTTKGIPSSVNQAQITISVRPVYRDAGLLELTLLNESIELEAIQIQLDGNELAGIAALPNVLSSGLHTLSISAPRYRQETVRFTVEPGKRREVKIELKQTRTALIFEAPTGTEVFLDGEMVETGTSIEAVEPGTHTVTYSLGGYRLTRNIELAEGASYRVSLNMDIKLSLENQTKQ